MAGELPASGFGSGLASCEVLGALMLHVWESLWFWWMPRCGGVSGKLRFSSDSEGFLCVYGARPVFGQAVLKTEDSRSSPVLVQ